MTSSVSLFVQLDRRVRVERTEQDERRVVAGATLDLVVPLIFAGAGDANVTRQRSDRVGFRQSCRS
jgi:hypothetical protein